VSFEDTNRFPRQSASPYGEAPQAPVEPPAEQPSAAEQTWGAAAAKQDRPRWTGRKTAVAVGVAVVIAAAGGVAIAAASGSTSSSSGNGPGGMGGGGMGGYGQMSGGGMGGASSGFAVLGSALHGDFVVSSGSGSYTTERLQKGKVTKSSSTSITVASDDGFTSTYVINSSTTLTENNQTVTSIPTGDTVTVIATLSGTSDSTATATSVTEGTTTTSGGPGGSGSGSGSGSGGPGGSGGTPPGMGSGSAPGN